MTNLRASRSALHTLALAILMVAFAPHDSLRAAPRSAAYAVAGAGLCVSSDDGACLIAAAASVDGSGKAAGAFALTISSRWDAHLVVSPSRGFVEQTGDGRQATFDGSAVLERAGTILERFNAATLVLDSAGRVMVTLDDETAIVMATFGGLGIREMPSAAAHSTHEVGHYIGLWHHFDSPMQPPALGMGVVVAGDGTIVTEPVAALPDVAGLFRDTAEGQTGHAHGHLDFLKQVGATTGAPHAMAGFQARGQATCSFEDEAERSSQLSVNLDIEAGVLEMRAPRCRMREALPIVRLPCPLSCRGTVLFGPASPR